MEYINKLSKSLEYKKHLLADFSKVVKNSTIMLLTKYSNTNVAVLDEVRKFARENDVYLKVMKNTLVRRAISGTNFDKLLGDINGQLIFAVASNPITVSQVVDKLASLSEGVQIISGVYNDEYLESADIVRIAKLPSREQLLSTFTSILYQIPASFARVIDTISKKSA